MQTFLVSAAPPLPDPRIPSGNLTVCDIENGPVEIVDLPIDSMVDLSSSRSVCHDQRVDDLSSHPPLRNLLKISGSGALANRGNHRKHKRTLRSWDNMDRWCLHEKLDHVDHVKDMDRFRFLISESPVWNLRSIANMNIYIYVPATSQVRHCATAEASNDNSFLNSGHAHPPHHPSLPACYHHRDVI